MICELKFDKAASFTGNGEASGTGYSTYPTTTTYHFENDYVYASEIPKINGVSIYATGQRGNCTVSRSLSKNLVATTLPVDSYYEGGLGVDVGFTDDSFSVSVETHSWAEYRYIMGLVKTNTGLRSGLFRFGPSSTNYDQFIVAVRNCNVTFASGKGFYCKISLSLMIVNSTTSD